MQAQGVSVNITGDLFLQLISVNTSVLVRDVLVLDAYFFFFVLCGVLLLYMTLPKPMVVRRPRYIPPASSDCARRPTLLLAMGIVLDCGCPRQEVQNFGQWAASEVFSATCAVPCQLDIYITSFAAAAGI